MATRLKTPVAIGAVLARVHDRLVREGIDLVSWSWSKDKEGVHTVFPVTVTLQGPCGGVTMAPAMTYNYCPNTRDADFMADEIAVTAWVLCARYIMWARTQAEARSW
jgi:hypothetical protein